MEASASYDVVTKERKDDWSSKTTPFRHFNNYVKKRLIQFSLDEVKKVYPSGDVAVLDLASGRGGDVGKWIFMQSPAIGAKAANDPHVVKMNHYDGVDISPEAVQEARRRFDSFPDVTCEASFTVADCFSETFLNEQLPQYPNYGQYSVVSIQFAIHYACETEAKIQRLVSSISRCMRSGGVVIVTTVDPYELSSRIRSDRLETSLYQIKFDQEPKWSREDPNLLEVGSLYHFTLKGFVDCPEFVVPVPFLCKQFEEVGFKKCEDLSLNFRTFLSDYTSDKRKNKGLLLSKEEEDLSTLYTSLCFVKL